MNKVSNNVIEDKYNMILSKIIYPTHPYKTNLHDFQLGCPKDFLNGETVLMFQQCRGFCLVTSLFSFSYFSFFKKKK
jgi:hypothetical protein